MHADPTRHSMRAVVPARDAKTQARRERQRGDRAELDAPRVMLREARGPASRFSDEIGSVIASLGAEAHRCVGEFGRLRQLVADIRASLSLTVTGLNLPDKEGPG